MHVDHVHPLAQQHGRGRRADVGLAGGVEGTGDVFGRWRGIGHQLTSDVGALARDDDASSKRSLLY